MPSSQKGKQVIYSLQVKAQNSEQQKNVRNVTSELQRDFPEVNVEIKVISKKLVPFEVVLEIVLKLTAEVASKILIKFLEKLWDSLKRKNVSPILSSSDLVRETATQYLRSIGVLDVEIVKMEDRGLYVFFAFREVTGLTHNVYITTFDRKVIRYERK